MNVIGMFLNTPFGSAIKVFIAVALTLLVTDWMGHGFIDFESWETWVIAGLASALPIIVNWLNPADFRYGNRSHE
jgi:hypothetical protein